MKTYSCKCCNCGYIEFKNGKGEDNSCSMNCSKCKGITINKEVKK